MTQYGVFQESISEDLFLDKKLRSMHTMCIANTGLGSLFALYYFYIGWISHVALISISAVTGFIIYLYALKSKNYRFGFSWQVIALWGGVCLLSIVDGGLMSGFIMISVILGPILTIGGFYAKGWWISGLTIAHFAVLLYLQKQNMLPMATQSLTMHFILSTATMTMFMLACFDFVKYIAKVFDKLESEHSKRRKETEKKHQFLIHINHELRNPLNAVTSAAVLLRNLDVEPGVSTADHKHWKQRLEMINSLQSSSEHILAVVNDVLDIERLNTGRYEFRNVIFRPEAIVRNVISMFAAKIKENGINIDVKEFPTSVSIWEGPADKVQQIILNLVANAILHGGKNIRVEISSETQIDKPLLILRVIDDGKGISEEAMTTLFEPFSSSIGFRGTSGLGLNICKLLANEVMKGQISVKSKVGSGTEFKVDLPLRPLFESSLSSVVERNDSETKCKRLQDKTILIVDDDLVNVELVLRLLEENNLNAFSAISSEKATEICDKQGPFDYAIIDHNLGPESKLNGLQLTAVISNGGGAKCIFGFTGNYSNDLENAWRALGAKAIIRKPASIESILLTLAGSA